MNALQTFNIRGARSGFFMGAVQLKSRTSSDVTALRLQRVMTNKYKRYTTVHPVLNMCEEPKQ